MLFLFFILLQLCIELIPFSYADKVNEVFLLHERAPFCKINFLLIKLSSHRTNSKTSEVELLERKRTTSIVLNFKLKRSFSIELIISIDFELEVFLKQIYLFQIN